jgi:RNA polymerase sigma factor (TIGR02999 family)
LVERARLGDRFAREAIYQLAFHRLKSIAGALLRRERPGHTLQPTALVNELFIKLQRFEARIVDEDHFFRVAARAMRQVLIDHSRTRFRARKISLERIAELLAADRSHGEAVITVKLVFEKLRELDPEVAQTVWMRSVEGLTALELAKAQNRELWRVRADYDFGLQWMATRLERA